MRIPILCPKMGPGINAIRGIGIQSLDPRWFFACYPRELRTLPPGTLAIDLCSVPGRTARGDELRAEAIARGLKLAPVEQLRALPAYVYGTIGS